MNREEQMGPKIKVMQAWVDGKTIQTNREGDGDRYVDDPSPAWDWRLEWYCIKPEPRTIHLAEFSDGTLGRQLLAEDEVSRYADPRMIRSTRLVKFVEVMEDEAKGGSIPAVKSVPPQRLPSTGPLVIGERVQFIGSLQGIPKGSLATVTAANPKDPTVGVEFDGGRRHKGFTVWRTSLERVADPAWTYVFAVGDEGHTTGGWAYKVVGKDEDEAANGQRNFLRVLHADERGEYWHALDGKHGMQEGFDLLPPKKGGL